MPSGPPSLLIACSAADPTPLRSGDSSESAADIEVASARLIPKPTSAIHPATNTPLDPTLVRDPISNPAATIANPTATATFAPTSRTIRSAGSAETTRPPINGNNLRPYPIGLVPSHPWKYCGIVNSTPNMAKIAIAERITPQV